MLNGLTEEELNLKNVVYCATFPNNKKYIGITTKKLKERLGQHVRLYKSKTHVFYNAINKYGLDNVEWSILKICNSIEELNNSEIHFIKELNTFIDYENSNGYNMTTGGFFTYKLSKESVNKNLGSNNKTSILTEDVVEDLKIRIANGEDILSLSKEFNIKYASIYNLKNLNNWSHIRPDLNDKLKNSIKNPKDIKSNVEKIKTMMYQGYRDIDIIKELGLNRSVINPIRNLVTHKDILSEYNEKIFSTVTSRAKFTDKEVLFIKESCIEKLDYEYLSENLNVNNDRMFKSRIRDIICVRRFVDIGSEYNDKLRRKYGKGQ